MLRKIHIGAILRGEGPQKLAMASIDMNGARVMVGEPGGQFSIRLQEGLLLVVDPAGHTYTLCIGQKLDILGEHIFASYEASAVRDWRARMVKQVVHPLTIAAVETDPVPSRNASGGRPAPQLQLVG